MVFHPSPKFPCLGISSSRTRSVLMSLLQTMAENILWDHGLRAEAGIGFFYVHLQVAMYRVMAAIFYYHADAKSPASNLFFWYLFYPEFSWLCFTSFFRCKNLCFQVHPPSTPPLPSLVLIYNIILVYFARCFVSAYSGFCTHVCQSLFHVRGFPQMSNDPGLPGIEENGTY